MKMREYAHHRYIAKVLSGNGELCTTPIDEESVANLKKAIDKRNYDAIHNKYWGIEKPEQFYICRQEWRKVFDENDHFVSEDVSLRRIELYPIVLES